MDHKKLLTEHGLWPIETWEHFEFTHKAPNDQEGIATQTDLLRSKVTKESGLYVYYKDGECIYVGKAAPLFNRLKSHYFESYKEVPGDTKNKKWHRFFEANTGRLMIYWKQIENETDRQIFEVALTAVLNPSFKQFR